MPATPPPPPPQGQADILDQLLALKTLDIPSRLEFSDMLMGLGGLQCIMLLCVGMLYLLCGYQAFKALVVANSAAIGAILGTVLGGQSDMQSMQVIGAMAGGLLLGVLAIPCMKYAVAVLGALAGSFIGYSLWRYIAELGGSEALGQHGWAGAMIGLIALGLLAFLMYKHTIIIFTSLEGALLALSGMLGLLMKVDAFGLSLRNSIVTNVHLMPLLVVVLMLVGVAFQHTGVLTKSGRKKAKPGAAVTSSSSSSSS